jgi:ACS family sodium-dependent inorganic phosphate cotransporter
MLILISTNVYVKLQTIGFIGPAVTLISLNYANTPTMAATLLTAALSLSSFSQAGFMLNIQVSQIHKNMHIYSKT